MADSLNNIGLDLKHRLDTAYRTDTSFNEPPINVADVGSVVAFAYEQLRNSTEYIQEHLLRQRAIRRFLIRNLSFHTQTQFDRSLAEEIIVELTQAGYIKNNTIHSTQLAAIFTSLEKHYMNFWRIKQHTTFLIAEEWSLDLLSVEIESVISNDTSIRTYQNFAYYHFESIIDRSQLHQCNGENYEASLYVAVHKTLLKSDLPTVRYDLQQLYNYPDIDIKKYVQFHEEISRYFTSDVTNKLSRIVDRHGAPLRIFKSMIDENPRLPALLMDSTQFLSAYETQVTSEYRKVGSQLNRALIRSILFLLITKSIVGVIVEIPYDILVTGSILIVPLVVNLLSPVAFLILQRASIKIPGRANTDALVHYMEAALYKNNSVKLTPKVRSKKYNTWFSIIYGAMFITAFGTVVAGLIALHFNAVQVFLFVIFLATASFLGFRLTRMIRELELVTARAGILQVTRDFLYVPFIALGRWLSEEYKKFNIIALTLDTAIELPLKTVLRLARQWTNYLNDKKEDM